MKKSLLKCLTLVVFFTSIQTIMATTHPKSVENISVEQIKKEKKLLCKTFKFQKRINKWQSRSDIEFDLKDPVDKWMWFWILGWGAGFMLSIALWTFLPASLWFLASLCWLFGTVSLVIWLIKKFS